MADIKYTLPPPTEDVEQICLFRWASAQQGKYPELALIVYNNNPVLKWCLANTGIVEDKNGNIKPNKTSKARKRIDGLAALLDAFVVFQDCQDDYKSML